MRQLLAKVDLVILALITVIAATLSIGDFFHFLPNYSQNYPMITLLLLAGLGLHLVTTRVSSENYESESLASLKLLLQNNRPTDVRVFEDSAEIENYLGKRISEATKSVCDLSWKNKIGPGFSASSRQLAHGYMDKCIAAASKRIAYREIFVFNDPRRVEKLRRRLAEKSGGYSCRHYPESRIPRLQFVVVDDAEVFFFASAPDSILCSVASVELAKVFRSYFDAAWGAATPIKEGPHVYQDEVDSIVSAIGKSKKN